MNNKGQLIFFTLMLSLTVVIFVMALAFPVKQSIDNVTNYSNNASGNQTTLDCNNDSISIFNKGACRIADITNFYFIGGLLFLVGSILAAKVLL